jgi:DNA-binding NtrC family response regulator
MRSELHNTAPEGGQGISATPPRTFLAMLPLMMGVAGWDWRTQQRPPPPGGYERRRGSKHRVYVVDDERDLTDLYCLCLEEAGYEVRVFHDRAEALQAFLADDPRPRLLITDYLGYPISAEELMSECRRAQPGLKILMASGCVEGCLAFAGVEPDRYLQKPFTLERFITEVRSLTGPPRPERTDSLQEL